MAELRLGVDGGATSTKVVLLDDGEVAQRWTVARCHFLLDSPEQIQATLASLALTPSHVGLFLAGCRTAADREQLRAIGQSIWPDAEFATGSDLMAAHAGALDQQDGILVLAGTGSAVLGRRNDAVLQLGGHGHIAGDQGGGFWLGQKLLEQALLGYDEHGSAAPLLGSLLARLCLNSADALVRWTVTAQKSEIAALAPLAIELELPFVHEGAQFLDKQLRTCIRRLELPRPGVVFGGSVLQNERYATQLKLLLADLDVRPARADAAVGAALLTGQELRTSQTSEVLTSDRGLQQSPTECRNPRTMQLDQMRTPQLVDLMMAEDAYVWPAVKAARNEIVATLELLVPRYLAGGRLFYIGAGTSGRLGVLDASECPPTFCTPPERVQGIIAGGFPALHSSAESREDDVNAGVEALSQRQVGPLDTVVGIAASGSTPFVLGALREAAQRGAATALITCNPHATFSNEREFVRIALDTGPELLAGSTRLKAGTATKLVLNQLSTITMIQAGKVVENLMIDLRPSCEKLRRRLTRILCELTGENAESAKARLLTHDWDIRRCLGS